MTIKQIIEELSKINDWDSDVEMELVDTGELPDEMSHYMIAIYEDEKSDHSSPDAALVIRKSQYKEPCLAP